MSAPENEAPTVYVHNAQRKPDSWDNLVDFAHDRLDPAKAYTDQEEAAAALWERVHTLEREEYEANRYYGLGLATCAFVRGTKSETAREALVAGTASMLVRGHGYYCVEKYFYPRDRGLYAKEIRGSNLANPALWKAEHAKLDVADRLVANTFAVALPVEPLRGRSAFRDRYRNNILKGEPALSEVARNTFAGTSLILRTILQRTHERRSGVAWPGDSEGKFNPPLSGILNEQELMSLDFDRVAFIAASCRLDELQDVAQLITLDEAGQPDIDHTLVPPRPGPIRVSEFGQPLVYHTARLRCPALYVAGAIPLVTQTFPEIVVRAQKQLLPDNPFC